MGALWLGLRRMNGHPHTAGKDLLLPGPGSPRSSCPGRAGMVSEKEGCLRVFGRIVAMGDLWDQSSQILLTSPEKL